MLDWLTDPFAGGLMQRALAEVLLLAVACGPLGVWVLLYRQSYAAESLSHAMLPGLVLAALAGRRCCSARRGRAARGRLASRSPRATSGSATTWAWRSRSRRCSGSARCWRCRPTSRRGSASCCSATCWGSPAGDLAEAAILAAGVAVALVLAHRRLALSVFDRAAAPSLGARPARWELALLALLALCTVAAVRALGNLLVVAMILAPAAAALNVARRLPAALGLAAVLAGLAGVIGLIASYHWEVAAGASVALAAVLVFLVSVLVPARRRA